MHYSVYVFIPKKGDIKQLVADALKPFAEDLEVPPYKVYLDPGEINAMAKCYRIRPSHLRRLARAMKNWNGGAGGVDDRGLFALKTWNPNVKWDWYEIGGRWDGRLPNNVTTARTLLKAKNLARSLPAKLITPDGKWHEWETFETKGWMNWSCERKPDSTWMKEVRKALRSYGTYRVVCVDIHS